MATTSPRLEWCIVRLGQDLNWWVEEISDPIRWDVDGLGIVDPRQLQHVLELCDPLRDYGFDPDVIDRAFYPFRIEKELKDGRVRVARTRESFLDAEEALFALPDILDEEKGPYADLLDQITRYRVKMLNDLIDFDHNLTIDELEEEIRDRQTGDFMEGRATHFFSELTAILEYVPDGYELDDDDDDGDESDELEDIPDFEEDNEKIEEDDTMKWDEDDDDEEEEGDEFSESPEGDDEDR